MARTVAVVSGEAGWAAEQASALRSLGYHTAIVAPEAVEGAGPALVDARAADAFDRLRRASVDIVLACDARSVDAVVGALGAPRVEPLHLPCRPADYALAFAALALDAPPASAADGDPANRLLKLSEEVARIARALAIETAQVRPMTRGADGVAVAAASVRALLAARRLRDDFLPADLFGEPAWDMLLELAASRIEARPVAVGDLAVAASGAPTTVLRYLKLMLEAGLVARRPDPRDGRRVFVELADDAFARVLGWFAAARKAGLMV